MARLRPRDPLGACRESWAAAGAVALLIAPIPGATIGQGGQPTPVLFLGKTVEGEITVADPVVRTDALDTYVDAPAVGKAYLLAVQEAGPCTIDLRSWFFDAYLVLRDEGGKPLAEDDDGLIGMQSRIVFQAEPEKVYRIEACALHGHRGRFEIGVFPGQPVELSLEARARAEVEDAERRLATVEAAYGPEHPDTGTCLNNLAMVLKTQGDMEGARPLCERALAILDASVGPEHPWTETTAENLLEVFENLGEREGSRSLRARRAEALERRLGPDHPEVATALNDLAYSLQLLGDYTAAEELFRRALAIWEKTLGPEHPEVAVGLNNLASLFKEKGDLAAARPLYERALSIQEKAVGPGDPSTARVLNNLANLLSDQGDDEVAVPLYERANAIRERVLGANHPDLAMGLNDLGLSLAQLGHGEAARAHVERALSIWESSLGPEHPQVGTGLCNMGITLVWEGRLAEALPHLERALAIFDKRLGPTHALTATVVANLAELHARRGDLEQARPLCERALAVLEQTLGPAHAKTAATRANLALLQLSLGEAELAWETLQRGKGAPDAYRARLLASLSEGERYRYLAGLLHDLEIALAVADRLGDPARSLSAYESVLSWKGRVARSLLASRGQLLLETNAEQRELVSNLQANQSRLSQLALQIDVRDPAAHAESIRAAREERSRLERLLQASLGSSGAAGAAPSFAELRSFLPETSAALDFFVHAAYRQPEKDGDRTLLGRLAEPHVSVWITRRESERPIHLDLGPAAILEDAVRAYREELRSRTSSAPERGIGAIHAAEASAGAGARLRDLLWVPIAHHVQGAETLFFSPDGFLGALPLGVLELSDGSYLLERFSVAYMTDLSDLGARRAAAAELDSLLSVGAVDFERRATLASASGEPGSAPQRSADLRGGVGTLAALPATDAEARDVVALHAEAFGEAGRRLLLEGTEPDEERLKEELPRYAIVHLATHGFFNPRKTSSLWDAARGEEGLGAGLLREEQILVGQNPGLLSGLACAGANHPEEEREDGHLTAEEVGWLDLSEVELVTLSACETGLGETRSGEGLIGLRRAFHTAGARTVVSSLWSVEDESTAELMRDFYGHLFRGDTSRLAALREAQLAMLAKNRGEHGAALPATWGAFVLSGEWR